MSDRRAHVRLGELDGLRGAGALLVLAFTLGLDGGGAAADLFFVLSGFVLARPFLVTGFFRAAGRYTLLRAARLIPLAVLGWGAALLITPSLPGPRGELRALLGRGAEPVTPVWWLAAELVAGAVMVLSMSVLPSRGDGPAERLDRRKFVPVAAVVGGFVALAASGSSVSGAGGLGRAFFGLGLGMLAFVVLDRRTSGLEPPLPFTEPAPGFPPGLGALLATALFAVCVVRGDLMASAHLVPPALVAAALVYCCAQRDDRGPVHRLLLTPPLPWLGARAYVLFAVQGVVVAASARIPESRLPSPVFEVAAVVASLGAAEVLTRGLALVRLPRLARASDGEPGRTSLTQLWAGPRVKAVPLPADGTVPEPRSRRERERRPVTPDLSQLTAAEALAVLTRPTWEGGALTRPHPATKTFPTSRTPEPPAPAAPAAAAAESGASPADTPAPIASPTPSPSPAPIAPHSPTTPYSPRPSVPTPQLSPAAQRAVARAAAAQPSPAAERAAARAAAVMASHLAMGGLPRQRPAGPTPPTTPTSPTPVPPEPAQAPTPQFSELGYPASPAPSQPAPQPPAPALPELVQSATQPFLPEPVQPPETIDLRSIPPRLRLRPIGKPDPEAPTDDVNA